MDTDPHAHAHAFTPERRARTHYCTCGTCAALASSVLLSLFHSRSINLCPPAPPADCSIPCCALVIIQAEGKTPFFVSTTAGTTVMGGFDPFAAIREISTRHGLWMHVDGAWGGSCVMSKTHRHLMAGAELADSLTWNPHKALGVPIYASSLITNNHKGALERSNNSAAEYLFHKHAASEFDLGDKSLQCGRRADALKLWLSWKRHGVAGFEKRVDRAFSNAQYITGEVKKRAAFALVTEPLSCNVAFWFVPEASRDAFAKGGSPACYDTLDTITGKIYNGMQDAGTMLVNFNPLSDHNLPRFFRIIMNQPRVTEADLDFVLDEIERLGAVVAAAASK
jgi:glutamate/tyrosine decarboxylase-like PLP-dependent enzyme